MKLDLQIRVPKLQRIIHWTNILETLKFAWIQYFALLIPTFYVVYYFILGVAFRNRALSSTVTNDLGNALHVQNTSASGMAKPVYLKEKF
jgi:hypothetical protein